MVFLSLKNEPLITADCVKWKELSRCQCPDGSRGISFIYLPPSLGDLECGLHWQRWQGGTRALLPGSRRACAQAFPGSKSAELVTAEAMKRPWQMWACSLILYEYWICFFFRGRVAVFLCSCSLLHVGHTQHWSGVLLVEVAKVHPGRYKLTGEQQERTRKWDGSVGSGMEDSTVLQTMQELQEHVLMPLQTQTEDFFFPSLLSGLLSKICLVVVNQNFLIAAQEFTLPQVMTF